MPVRTGQSAVVVPVPDLDPVVGAARDRFDPAAVLGVPAHVTVVYPLLPLPTISPVVVAELAVLVAAEPAPTVVFARCARFPGVLWLDPEPAEPFVRLTRALVARWSEAPPYGGEFGDDVVVHVTVTATADDAQMADVERAITASLPVTTTVTEALLIGFDGRRWSTAHRLPFGSGQPAR